MSKGALRESWAETKKSIEEANKNKPEVTKLLKSFDGGLGPILDKIEAARDDLKKQGDAAMAVLDDYLAKFDKTLEAKEDEIPLKGKVKVKVERGREQLIAFQRMLSKALWTLPR